jgi:hypothetical protein
MPHPLKSAPRSGIFPTQRYTVVNQAVISNDGCFAHHNTHTVVDDHPAAHSCTRMNFDTGKESNLGRNNSGQQFRPHPPQRIRQSVPSQSVHPG